ncbi:MAG: hypothetical protein A2X49_15960 [Lentisphaerae bacterium GWF2_52_8]|nr:MAG: hypothetical protein A2X49_15960 [Lentisphaerae bacterium GWF2_52_8]
MKIFTRNGCLRLSLLFIGLGAITSLGCCASIKMPGHSFPSSVFTPSDSEKALALELRRDVEKLATEIGPRNLEHYDKLNEAANWLAQEFRNAGCSVSEQSYNAEPGVFMGVWNNAKYREQNYRNIIGELKGSSRPDEIIVIGAHYDSVALDGCRGANDNASGVACVLALARHFAKSPASCTLRFVAFANEEPPFFWTAGMGSCVYAKECRTRKEKIIAMLCPETIGCYSEIKGSQHYPPPLNMVYPDKGNFIAFVGNTGSASLVRRCVGIFRETTQFPSEGAALPGMIPGIGWSDHWSFWKEGYQALMITDTAPFRYPFYHTNHDDPDKIDYTKMARVVEGIGKIVKQLAN